MGIFDNKIHLALVAIVGAAIIGMVMAPSLVASGQTDTPVQFPASTPPGAPEETPEEEPAPGEEAPAPEEPLPTLGEEAPAPGEEPLPGEEAAPVPGEEAPLPEEEPLPAPAPLPEEAPALGEEPEGLTPEEPEEIAPEEEEAEGAEGTPEGMFSTSMSMSPTPDSEGTVAIEGAGLTIQDMKFDQSTEGANSKVRVEATFGVEPDGSDVEPMSAEREDGSDGFFNAVQFSPAEGSWANIIIEGTGLTVQGMSVNQSMGPPSPSEEPMDEEAPTPEEEPLPPLPEEEPPAPEEPLPAPGEEAPAPAPGEEVPAPEEPLPAPGEEATVPEEEPLPAPAPAPAPLPEEAPALGEEPEGLTPEEPEEIAPEEEEAAPEEAEGETFTVVVEVTFAAEGGAAAPATGIPAEPIVPGLITPEPVIPTPVPPAPTAPETTVPVPTEALPSPTGATLEVIPATGIAGSQVTASGTAFTSNQSITLDFDGAPVVTDPITSDATGSFSAPVTVPMDAAAGDHQVTATDGAGTSAVATFTVEGPAIEAPVAPVPAPAPAPITPEAVPPTPEETVTPTPTAPTAPAPEGAAPAPTAPEATLPEATAAAPIVTLDITSGAPGTTVNVNGSGFPASSNISVMFDGQDAGAGPVTADASGAFTASVTIPDDAAEGPHDITAQDDIGNSATMSFIVTAAAAAPTETAPEAAAPVEVTPTETTTPEETTPAPEEVAPTEETAPTTPEETTPQAEATSTPTIP